MDILIIRQWSQRDKLYSLTSLTPTNTMNVINSNSIVPYILKLLYSTDGLPRISPNKAA